MARLQLALRASALYDLSAFVLLLAMPAWLFELFAHPVPTDPFLFRMAALPLWMAPVVYWMAAQYADRCPALVIASVRLRIIGAIGIAALVLWSKPEGAMAYWVFVLGDVIWAGLIEFLRRQVPQSS